VKESARCIGVEKLALHDLRRYAESRLCHASGRELELIQFLLGHVSVQTTERYLGCKERIVQPSMIASELSPAPKPPAAYGRLADDTGSESGIVPQFSVEFLARSADRG
jgi:hypothetical protein